MITTTTKLSVHQQVLAATANAVNMVAHASNIAFDCEAEFDDQEALARWSQAAATANSR